MPSDPDKVWPTGLTVGQAEELHSYILGGTRAFFLISACAHVLAYILTPWLK